MKYFSTPIYEFWKKQYNIFYIKRDDLIPFSFGGNKARKAKLFFDEIDRGEYDCVVTYGSGSSNHCRVVANMAAARGMKCYIISPEEASDETYNSQMMSLLGAEITVCPVCEVHDTIEKKLELLRLNAYTPYFIAGGGHGNLGTQAYVDCYEEIREYESKHHIHFDYIFHASGTGTTQAGLICGQLMHRDERKIVGISIARKNPRGKNVVTESIKSYLSERKIDVADDVIDEYTTFIDEYTSAGYAAADQNICEIIDSMLLLHGIPLDPTYTGKAFCGMMDYLKVQNIVGKNILFIHTGGTPLFFDYLKKRC